MMHIPGDEEWRGYETDLDAKYAHTLLFGKSIDEVQPLFGGGRSIERADELRFVPGAVFRYYVHAFAKFVKSDAAKGDPDSASSFLHLLATREERDVSAVYDSLAETIEFIASHQQHYRANREIYGSFRKLATKIRLRVHPR
jgi:hypothetical protein